MQFGNSQETLESLQSLESDIAILAAVTENPNIVMKHYSKHKVIVFVNRDHRFFDRDSVKLAELQDENFILREKGSTTRQAFDNALSLHGVTVNNVMEIGSREGVWKAVLLGLGISVVADFEFVATPELRTVDIEDVEIESNYFITYLRDREDAAIIKAFIDLNF